MSKIAELLPNGLETELAKAARRQKPKAQRPEPRPKIVRVTATRASEHDLLATEPALAPFASEWRFRHGTGNRAVFVAEHRTVESKCFAPNPKKLGQYLRSWRAPVSRRWHAHAITESKGTTS